MKREHIVKFLEQRPYISKSHFCKVCGISHQALNYFINGQTKHLHPANSKRLKEEMKKCGWKG
jgi:hypothetical protein